MKKILLSIIMPLAMTAASAQSFHLEADLAVQADTFYVMNHRSYARDTITNSKGRFTIDLPMKEMSEVTISRKSFPMPGDEAVRFVAFPGDSVSITGSFAYYQLKGSDFYEGYDRMQLMLLGFNGRSDTNIRWSQDLRDKKVENDVTSDVFQNIRNDVMDDTQNASAQYMALHPDEECSALLLENIHDVHLARECYDMLSERVRNGRMASVMAKYMDHVDKEISRLKRAENIQPGKVAPLFALKDLRGKTVKLEKLRGQWVVLDFWGSWCFWCINGVPQMREYYNNYKGKFQILGIDCYDKPEAWRKAVEKNDMPWLHVTDPVRNDAPKEEAEKGIAYRYAVSGFPTKVIVRPDGVIDSVFVGEKEEFYQYLDKLFK